MYKIDVPTYHWDNDYFLVETRVLRFGDAENARAYQEWLRSLQFWNDALLCCPSFNPIVRDGKTHEIPHHNSHAWQEEYHRIDVYQGAIIEASFDIYTEEVIRTKIGT